MKNALVVGAGVAGLAAAVRLRLLGYEVQVFEANAYPGGKLSVFEQDGYRFDAGPSLFTMPHLITELIEEAGKKPEDYFEYLKVDEACRYFWDDGTHFTAWSQAHDFAKEAEKALGEPASNTLAYLQESAFLYNTTRALFLESSLHKVSSYFRKEVLPALFAIHRLHLGGNLNQLNQKRFKTPKMAQLFNRFATYNGSSPYLSPGVMQIIPHLEHNIGTFYPQKGMYAITQALYNLGLDLGVCYHFNTPVKQILVQKGRAIGIQTPNETLKAKVVLSNADVHTTYRKLLPGQKAPERILRQERSSSALIFYWGINRVFNNLGLHNIFFSNHYEQEFEAIFKNKTSSGDPTVYVNITSKYTPTDAPPGCENWFVMVNVPGDFGQDWSQLTQLIRQKTLERLNVVLGVKLEDHIVSESILDPPTIEAKTSSYRGALYGTSSNDPLSAFFRHPNFSSQIKGLYFAGGSAHPGGGIPLCMLSAKIATQLIAQNP